MKHILIFFAYIFVCQAQLFFYDSHVKVLSTLNLTNLGPNRNNVGTLLNTLTNFKKNFPASNYEVKMQKMSPKGPYVQNLDGDLLFPLTRPNLHLSNINMTHDKMIQNIFTETRNGIDDCVGNIRGKLDEINHDFNTSSSGHRYKRDIIEDVKDTLGGLVHFITGVPGPAQYSHEMFLLHDMEKAVSGEQISIHTITQAINHTKDIIKQVVPLVTNYTGKVDKLEKKVDLLYEMFFDALKIDRFCDECKSYSYQAIIKQAKIVERIMDKAIMNLPDPYLFPIKKLERIMEQAHSEFDTERPFFVGKEISKVHSLNSALTIMHKDVIYAVLHVPILDMTYSYTMINYPNFHEDDIHTMNTISKIALREIDIFACNSKSNDFTLFSSAELQMCTRWHNIHLCHHRHIRMSSGPLPCSEPRLSKSVVYELGPNKLLVKADSDDTIRKVCGETSTVVEMNSIYNKVHLPSECELHGDHFTVSKYKNEEMKILNTTFKIVPIAIEHIDFTPFNEKIHNHTIRISQLSKDLIKIIEDNNLMDFAIKNLKDDYKRPNFTTIASKVSLASIIAIVILVLVILFYLYLKMKCCQNSNSTVKLELGLRRFFPKPKEPEHEMEIVDQKQGRSSETNESEDISINRHDLESPIKYY